MYKFANRSLNDHMVTCSRQILTVANISRVYEVILGERRIEVIDTPSTVCVSVIREHLFFEKVRARRVSQMKAQRVSVSVDNLNLIYLEGNAFLKRIVTYDETCVY